MWCRAVRCGATASGGSDAVSYCPAGCPLCWLPARRLMYVRHVLRTSRFKTRVISAVVVMGSSYVPVPFLNPPARGPMAMAFGLRLVRHLFLSFFLNPPPVHWW